jgi:uncharacterized metal-binding protein YceD (DUF177 family)
MDIDLSLLQSGTVPFIDITGEYDLNSSYYENTDVKGLNNVLVNGKIVRKENDDFELDDYIECTITGDMIISDSISLEEVNYPFSIEYDDFIEENCIKNKNILDIFQFIWENIVLEVPLQFTKVEDLSKFHGDGWKLISEDELKFNNSPFSNLLKDFEEE